jgi:hypothetical protein
MDYILGKISIFGKNNAKDSSDFSHFFRNASSGEKKRVFMDVARKASKEQREVLEASAKK